MNLGRTEDTEAFFLFLFFYTQACLTIPGQEHEHRHEKIRGFLPLESQECCWRRQHEAVPPSETAYNQKASRTRIVQVTPVPRVHLGFHPPHLHPQSCCWRPQSRRQNPVHRGIRGSTASLGPTWKKVSTAAWGSTASHANGQQAVVSTESQQQAARSRVNSLLHQSQLGLTASHINIQQGAVTTISISQQQGKQTPKALSQQRHEAFQGASTSPTFSRQM
eukprot:1150815-Pelagomonas_calceolata.AAC.1